MLDIVPDEERLIIQVKINPKDIDVVHEGLPAIVHFPAFKQRNMARIEGRVTGVAADATLGEPDVDRT